MEEFKALLRKNFILYRRNWFGSFAQVFIPILFAIFFLVSRKAYPTTEVPAGSYVGQVQYSQQYYSQQILKQNNIHLIKSCSNNSVQGEQMRNGVVVLGPEGEPLAEKLENVFSGLGYTTKMVKSNAEINNRVAQSDYGLAEDNPFICFSVIIESPAPNYSFRIRFNISDDISSEGPSTFNPVVSMMEWNYWAGMATSRTSGLFQVNNILLNLILQNQTQNQSINLRPSLSPMGHKTYVNDDLFAFIKDFIDIFTLFPCIIIFLRMTSTMLKEKQGKIRQIMKIMGMSPFLNYATWIFKYFMIYFMAHLFVTLIFYYTFNYIDFGLVFVTFILFDLVLIVQSLCIQTFFSEAVLGTLTALTLFFIEYIISFVIKSIEVPSELQLILFSICPHTALVMIMEEIFYSNFCMETVTWKMFTKRTYNYTVSIGFTSLLLNIVFWAIITMYLEEVVPSGEGIKKHPCFIFGYPHHKIEKKEFKGSVTAQNIQRRLSHASPTEGIFFNKVWKKYNHNQKVAVKNLTLHIERNSVFTLLGHNGAGKTTTLSMMSGITEVTEGEIFIEGENIKVKSKDLKQIMGFCPQHNTLYDELTVFQHLELFSRFKKADKNADSYEEIISLLDNLYLKQKINQFPNNLSGGQKRRLQLALSFVGGSKIIFLDQPTSGLDSYSRRKVWNFIRKRRTGKIIILTTHFMDEAEALSDKLGIMKDGKLVCCGTAHSLKEKWNIGYRLNIEKQHPSVPKQPIIEQLRKIYGEVEVQSTISSELVVKIPTTRNLRDFAQLFKLLEQKKRPLRIKGYGVNTGTLEEVLLSINDSDKLRSNTEEKRTEDREVLIADQLPMPTHQHILPHTPSHSTNFASETECSLFFKRIWITICKRAKLTFRNVRLLLLEIVIPLFMVLVVFGVQKAIGSQTLPAYQMTPALYDDYLPVKLYIASTGSDQIVSDLSYRLEKDNLRMLNIEPIYFNINDLGFFDKEILVRNKNKQTLAGVLITQNDFTSFHILPNTHSVYAALVSLNTISQSAINIIASSNISITPILDPLPFTKHQIATYENPATSFLVAIIFSIALSYKYGSSIYQVVKERESNCKHLQIISGMGLAPFWIGNFLFDFTCFLLFTIFSLSMCKAFDLSQLIGTNIAFSTTVAVFLLYGVSQQIFTYICSFLFKDHSNAQSMFYFFNFMFGAMMPVVVLVFRYIGGVLTNVGLGLSWVFRFIPSFSFGEALINLESRSLLSKKQNIEYSPMDVKIALYDIYFLGLTIPLFIAILLIIQQLNWTNLGQSCKKTPTSQDINLQNLDRRVRKQALKAQQADPEAFPILLKNVTKTYQSGDKSKVAVNHLNLVIQKGEVFGLLGVNGAGKSSTFKILTRDILASAGEVYMNGHNIQGQFQKVKTHVGYCPQFCALFENMTVRQQLELYYKIKGLCQLSMKKQVDDKIKIFNIEQYQKVFSKDLSGGNQRKLSMALALIGNPSVVLLDEPSTGVDPSSKRFMWKIIKNLNMEERKTTVVLTTHSMEQAEFLSTRIGIMSEGNFKCLGSLEGIKNDYSEGFFLQLRLKKVNKQRFRIYLQKLGLTQKISTSFRITSQNIDQNLQAFFPFNQPSYIESKKAIKELCSTYTMSLSQFLERMIYEIQGQKIKKYVKDVIATSSDFKEEHDTRHWKFKFGDVKLISNTIIRLEAVRNVLEIEQYHINSTTLEEILNKFSQEQENSCNEQIKQREEKSEQLMVVF